MNLFIWFILYNAYQSTQEDWIAWISYILIYSQSTMVVQQADFWEAVQV